MPLILDPAVLPLPELRKMSREMTEGLTGLAEWAADPKLPAREPLGVRAGAELFRAAAALGASAEEPSATAPQVTAIVNAQYEAMIAGIDLVKMHSDLPKVPKGS